jgi:hypothetical protein
MYNIYVKKKKKLLIGLEEMITMDLNSFLYFF